MADVMKRVSGKMQLDTEGGGVVRATSYEMAVETNKALDSFTGQIDVTKAEKEATGRFTAEIGVTNKAVLNEDVVAGSSIDVTKVVLGNKEEVKWAPEAGLGIKMPATVTWVASFKRPSSTQKKPREERSKAEHAGPLVTKETVPDHEIQRMKTRPMKRMSPLSGEQYNYFSANPTRLALYRATIAYIDHMVDVEEDCLRQHAERGYAEIGVDYTSGTRVVFILPSQASSGGN